MLLDDARRPRKVPYYNNKRTLLQRFIHAQVPVARAAWLVAIHHAHPSGIAGQPQPQFQADWAEFLTGALLSWGAGWCELFCRCF